MEHLELSDEQLFNYIAEQSLSTEKIRELLQQSLEEN